MDVDENIFLFELWTESSDCNFKKILIENHYKTIYEPARSDCTSCMLYIDLFFEK